MKKPILLVLTLAMSSLAYGFNAGDNIACENKYGIVQEIFDDGKASVKFISEFDEEGRVKKEFQEEVLSLDISHCDGVFVEVRKVGDEILCKNYIGTIKKLNEDGAAQIHFTKRLYHGKEKKNFKEFTTTHKIGHCHLANKVDSLLDRKVGEAIKCGSMEGVIEELRQNGMVKVKFSFSLFSDQKNKEETLILTLNSCEPKEQKFLSEPNPIGPRQPEEPVPPQQ